MAEFVEEVAVTGVHYHRSVEVEGQFNLNVIGIISTYALPIIVGLLGGIGMILVAI